MKKLTLLALLTLFGSQVHAMKASPRFGTSLVEKAINFDGAVSTCELEENEIKELKDYVAETNRKLGDEKIQISKQYMYDLEITCVILEKVKKDKSAKKNLLI